VKGSSYSGAGYPVASNQNNFTPSYTKQLTTPVPTTPGVGAPAGAAQSINPSLPVN